MVMNVITPDNLGLEFELGTSVANKITVNVGAGLSKDPTTGQISFDPTAVTVTSSDAGNLLTAGGDNGVFFDQAALQASETAFSGTSSGFLTVAPAGTNGHAPTFSFDYEDAAFVEGVQDAIGQAITSTTDGISYDDALNVLTATIASLAAGDGVAITGGNNISVTPDPASPLTVSASAAGVNVAQTVSTDIGNLANLGADAKVNVAPAAVTALATEEVQDAFGVTLFKAFP